jgi:pimeloyl-ACP methyl ester carboxylesterase
MPVYHTARGDVEMLEWGDGPELLVMLHAAAAGPQSLGPLAALLMRPGLRIVAPALNRYGATRMLDEADRVQAHVDVLRAVLELCPAERRTLFGHSMGGLIGLLEAESFDTVVLYEPIVTACVNDQRLLQWDRAIVATGDVATFVSAWNGASWESLPPSVQTRLAAMAPMLTADMHAVSHYAPDMERFARLRVPVLLLQGEISPPITHAMTARLAELLPRSQRIVVQDCGHMGPVQAANVIASAAKQSQRDLRNADEIASSLRSSQ